MAVTRINNNQITDASAGNVYVGINAGTKLQDYSITAGKIANSLTYGSDLTITGNLTVNGQTTTIDTVSTVIEDPLIVLASNQTGSPSVDIGFIGERGTANNIAFIWDESATEFATTFTSSLVTNTTVTISSYANFHTNDANVGGNLAVGGNISITGNVTSLNVTGNITGGNLLTPGVVTATGNITGGNVTTAGQVTATGNVSGGNINLSGNIVDSGALTIITGSGNVSLAPGGTTTVEATATGANITGTLNATGNANVGNLGTAGQVTATGNVTGGNLVTAGLVSAGTTITATGNITGGNVSAGSGIISTTGNINGGNVNATTGVTSTTVTASGNISGGNLTTTGITSTGSLTASTTINATGNITGGNLTTAGLTQTNTLNVTAGANVGTTLGVTGNITGGNLTTSGITSTGSLTASTTINATGNITGGNLITTGVTQTGTLTTTGNALVGGNLIVQGNITYINIDDLRVEDPIIILGTGPNGAPLTTDDGMDRGTFMEYYKSGAVGNAFMGWDNSSGNMVIAASASFSGNNVVAYNAFGTLQAGNLFVQSVVSTGNVTGGNLLTAGLISATGNITGGNVTTGGQVSATGNVNGGNLNATTGVRAATGYFTGNVDVLGNLNATVGVVYANSGIFLGDAVTGNNAAFAGVPGFTQLGSNVVMQFAGNVNSYSQLNFENINTGTQASTDFILTADNGNDGSNFFNMGITGSNWDGTQPNSLGNALRPNDGYLYADSGNVIIGTTVPNDHVRIIVGGDNNNFVVAEFHDPNTNAVSTTTGTLTITGGIGATGNIYGANIYTPGLVSATGNVSGGNVTTAGLISAGTTITATGNVAGGNLTTGGQVTATGNVTGGNVVATALVTGANVTASANVTGANVVGTTSGTFANIRISTSSIDSNAARITINGADADVDFAVDGDTLANVFYVDAGTGTASFGTSTQTTNAIVAFNATNSVLMPVGNIAQRPGTGVTGMLRFNTTSDALEVYDNSQWTTVGVPSFTVIDDQQFTGNGVQVAFTINSNQTTNSCIVSINGVVQIPTIAYSVSGTTLTFTEAPETGDIIDVRQITTTTTVTSISNSSGNAAIGVSDTSNDVSVTGDLVVAGSVSASSFIGLDATSIANGTSSMTVIASGGNIRANIGGSTVQTISAGLVAITGDLSVTGNATLSGNILGDRVTNGTTSFEIQTPSGNANISVSGTSNVAVFTTTGMAVAGTVSVSGTGNITGANLIATADVFTPEIVKTGSNAVGNIGQIDNYFNRVFAQATSALYADLAEKYVADAEYTAGTVVVFGGDKEVTVTTTDADRAVAGVVSTNPSYIMNAGLEAEHVATVALTGRVPCRVTGTVRKGDLMVSAGYGMARAEADPRVGTVIGKALENHEGAEGVIEVVVGRF
jgi:hypothetical protein